MISLSHSDIEDAYLAALAFLTVAQGGPLRTLQTSSAYSLEEAMRLSASKSAPACLVLATEARPSPLRPGGRHEVIHTTTLLLAARSFRSRQTAARGTDDRTGVYDLLAATKEALSGRIILGASGSELSPGRERLLTSSPTLAVWGQEWAVTLYQ